MAYGKPTDGAQVTVTTGTDFIRQLPRAAADDGCDPPAATTALPSSPVHVATASANAAFSSPTKRRRRSPPDPRSCSAIGGEGT